jgi:HK97 family phage prohead protease
MTTAPATGRSAAAADGPDHFRAGGVDNSAWDAAKAWANGAAADNPASFYNGICAGKKAGDPSTQAAHALPHHYHPGDAPNAAGVAAAQGRIGSTQGLTNKAAAQAHLDAHTATIQAAKAAAPAGGRARARARPGLREVAQARAAGCPDRRAWPNGDRREQGFGSLLRAAPVMKDGAQYYEVEGVASVVDQPYEMYDMFGPYDEVVQGGAFVKSMATPGLDVAFLVNHKGLTMARTKNGSLSVWTDPDLSMRAFLNASRYDVRDLVSAITDELIDEMSFAFWLRDGHWSDDYMTYYISEADIHRGDVSAVNYGASPWTSIAARSGTILAELERIPAGAARAAVERLLARADLGDGAPSGWSVPGRVTRTGFAPGGPLPGRGDDGTARRLARLGKIRQAARDTDPDDSAESLIASLDALLDQASTLAAGVDAAGLPADAGQALALITAAEAIADQLMDLFGIYDPDDQDSGVAGAGALAAPERGLVGYRVGGTLHKPEDVEIIRTWDQAPAVPDGLFPPPSGNGQQPRAGMSTQMLAMQHELDDELDDE